MHDSFSPLISKLERWSLSLHTQTAWDTIATQFFSDLGSVGPSARVLPRLPYQFMWHSFNDRILEGLPRPEAQAICKTAFEVASGFVKSFKILPMRTGGDRSLGTFPWNDSSFENTTASKPGRFYSKDRAPLIAKRLRLAYCLVTPQNRTYWGRVPNSVWETPFQVGEYYSAYPWPCPIEIEWMLENHHRVQDDSLMRPGAIRTFETGGMGHPWWPLDDIHDIMTCSKCAPLRGRDRSDWTRIIRSRSRKDWA